MPTRPAWILVCVLLLATGCGNGEPAGEPAEEPAGEPASPPREPPGQPSPDAPPAGAAVPVPASAPEAGHCPYPASIPGPGELLRELAPAPLLEQDWLAAAEGLGYNVWVHGEDARVLLPSGVLVLSAVDLRIPEGAGELPVGRLLDNAAGPGGDFGPGWSSFGLEEPERLARRGVEIHREAGRVRSITAPGGLVA
ncbi:MAG: hypothetical protein FJ098_12555, partial [Deltaproteobacteria bacterium]|nr:hypothetical protein [Deltaproteobacteria bacterium]